MGKMEMSEETREMFRRAGSKGGRTTLERHGPEHYARISQAGGLAAAKAKRLAEIPGKTAEPANTDENG